MNIKGFTKSPLACALTLAMSVVGTAHASDTTSAIRGLVVGPQGNAVTDAQITIVHQPSGTTAKTEVNETGAFFVRGLRVGGPYTVIVDSDKFADDYREGLMLQLGETLRFRSQLAVDDADVERISIVGSVELNRIGANSEFGETVLAESPAINRDLKEIARMNPFAVMSSDDDGSFSIAGQNPRYNTVVVDGISQNDDFGLNGNGYPTQRSPISMDAVESVAVNVVPMSARYNGFTGGQLNVVTRSGTNELTGSVFYEYSSDSMAGDGELDGTEYTQDFEETTYGGHVGFPIIKDKLFFFGTYESYDSPSTATWTANADGSGIQQSTLDELIEVAESVYGVDVGSANAGIGTEDKKYLMKVDWNINDDHRVNVRYQYARSNEINNSDSYDDEVNLSSYWYDKEETMKAVGVEWFANWSQDFTTELRISHKDTTSTVNPVTDSGMGQVTVLVDGGEVNLGTEQYRHANELDNQNLEVNFLGSYFIGDHQINFGYQYNNVDVFNMFVAKSLGVWDFDSIDDFENGEASEFAYANSYTGDPRDAAAEFSTQTHAAFIEDIWQVTPDFELTMGLRYERLGSSDTPTYNGNFEERYGFANTTTTDGLDLFLPRLGMKWYATDNLTIHGGIGRYSGGQPNVWLGNNFSNDGITLVTASSDVTDLYLSDADPREVPSGVQDSLEEGDGYVNALDPNFEIPSDWRYNLGAEYVTESDWLFTGEFLYVDSENGVKWTDLAREESGTTLGGRTVYTSDDRYDLLLSNDDGGAHSRSISLSMSKEWENGLRFSTSYTNSDVVEGNAGTSSQATSNYQYNVTRFDRNGTHYGRGYYEVEHRWQLNLGYKTELLDGYKSTFNLYWERRSGRPLTYTLGSYYDTDLGDQSSFSNSDYYTPYIPYGADDPSIDWDSSDVTYDELMVAVDAAGLGKYAGTYGVKGTRNQPWVSELDFRFTQELPGLHEKHRLILDFTVENVLNFLNDDWGAIEYESYGSKILVDYEYDQDTQQYTYTVPYGQDGLDASNRDSFYVEKSFWKAKLGLRYNF